jgi:hypothetical protein
MNRAKVEALRPALMGRIDGLANKLDLVSQNKIGSVPMQAPNPNFHFQHPAVDPTKPLKLSGFSTNVRKGLRGFEGNADGSTGIRSAKALKAQYKPLPGQKSQDGDDDDDAGAMDLKALQQQIRGGIEVMGGSDDDDGGIVGGFDNNGDDDDAADGADQQQQQQQEMKKRVYLPKAADKKQTGNRKMKKTPDAPSDKKPAPQMKRVTKQGGLRNK